METARDRAAWTGRLAVVVLCSILASSRPGHAQTAFGPKGPAPQPVVVTGTQELPIHSAITGQEYVLQISLPRGYEDGKSTFPVIYALDGQWDFTLIHAIYGQLYYDGFVPGAIIVGITWGGANPDYDKRRAFDLTPTDSGQPAAYGNAARFLAFVKNEAIPLIESRFRTAKNERTLTGSSFGGLFALYALSNEPELFNQYAITSPAWAWDRGALLTHVEKFSRAKLSRPVKAFMGIGEYEDVPGFEKLAAALRAAQPAGLEVQTKVITGAGHSGAKAEGYTRGLQFAFARPCVNVNQKMLERYAGEYEVNPENRVRLAVDSGQLVAVPSQGPKVTLCAETDTDFHIIGQFKKVRFEEGPDGTVSGFHLQEYSGGVFVKRVK